MKKILPTLIVLALCFQYLLLSINANELTRELVGNNSILKLFELSNNLTLFLFPIIILLFIVGSTKYMLEIFDEEKISSSEIYTIVGYALMFPLIGMFFYTTCFFLRDYQVSSLEDLKNLHFLFGLTINDFNYINKLFWLLAYFFIFYQLCFNKNIVWWKVILSLKIPVLIVLLIGFIIN
jgi:membrane protein